MVRVWDNSQARMAVVHAWMGFSMSPFEMLEIPPESTPLEVKMRWRILASEHHPDKGGDASKFDMYRSAYEEALRLSEMEKPCDECGGAGKITTMRGFHQIKVACPICSGSGIK
jgi:DnaJ-class molecular chaperone